MHSLWVGIDVSRDYFSAGWINSGGEESFAGSYSKDSKGFEELLKVIRTFRFSSRSRLPPYTDYFPPHNPRETFPYWHWRKE